jgi:thiol-disulfide isomerase/thioredoxin
MGVAIKDLESYNQINDINFGETVVFFKFGAEWCVPCLELEKIINDIPDSVVYTISIDNEEFESFLTDNKIYSLPDTMVKYKNSTTRFQGLRTRDEIVKIIDDLKKA